MITQIKLHWKQLISLCIALAMMLSTVGITRTVAYAAENDFEEVTLSLNSTVVNDSSITLYLCESVHYISIDDLCELTRCSKSVEGNTISVTQGFWRAIFDVEEQLFDDGYQSVATTILAVSADEYAVPALMFLSYFKAIAFIENDTLYCRMPEFTAWEALNVDYSNSLVDIYELYGGEGNVIFSLTLDIIIDFIMGDMSTSDDYLSDAFLEALKVDLYDYSSVQKYKESSQSDLYSDLHSDKGEEFVEAIEDTLSVAAEPTQWYIQYYYNAIEKSFVSLAYDAFEAGQHADVKHYGEKFYEAFTEKNKTSETAEKYFDNADYVMLFVSAAVDTAQQMKYTNATNNLVYNVMGQKNLNYLGISADDNDWFTVANRYKNVLGVAATQIEAEAMQLFTDKLCWETLIGTGVSSAAGISGGAWTFSLNFARLFVENFPLTSSSVEAFKADRRALFLSELQQNVYWVAMNTLQNMQGQWDNPEIYTKYIQALQLYCRTSIAMYENLITMVDEFGQDRDYWTSLFQARIDMLAVSLYQLTTFQDDGVNNCLPLELSSFSNGSKDNNAFPVLNDGGLAVSCGNVLLYWNILDNGDTVSYVLVSEDNNGKINEIYKSAQRSNIYVIGNTIFLNERGKTYQDLWSVSMDFEGRNVVKYEHAQVVGVDQATECIIMDYVYGDTTREAGFYIYHYSDGHLTWIDDLSTDAYFLQSDDGIAYFGQSFQDDTGVILFSYNIETEDLEIVSNAVATYPVGMGPGLGYSPCEIVHIQVTDVAIFYSYGYYGGTAMVLQPDGGIIRVCRENLSSTTVSDYASSDFYVFYEEGIEYLQNNGNVIDIESGNTESTDMHGSLNIPFDTFSDGITRTWVYLTDDGEAIQILPEMVLGWEGNICTYLENVNYVGSSVFYDLVYEKENPSPNSWRDYTVEYKRELYVYNSTTKEVRLLSSVES